MIDTANKTQAMVLLNKLVITYPYKIYYTQYTYEKGQLYSYSVWMNYFRCT